MSSKLLRGTFILTAGTIISKMLGLFYVIPFYRIIGGEESAALYQFGYVPYSLFISVATAGVPLAVSKYIAKYNALEEYAVGRKLFKSGIYLMLFSGFMAFLIMYSFAPYFGGLVLKGQKDAHSFSVDDVATVIRAVSFALIVVPFMSLIRGFFQGHQSMGPSAVSQVVEQIARIVFLLVGAYAVLNLFNGSIVTAISVATFAAFIGAIAGLFVLFWYWKKRKPYLDALLEKDKGTEQVSLVDMYKEIILSAIPFVLVGVVNPLYQLVDQLTFSKAMSAAGKGEEALELLGIFNFAAHKLVVIPLSLATAFALTLVPLVTESFVRGNSDMMKKQIDQIFQVLLFITIPAAIGLSILAEPAYAVFYGLNHLGTNILMAYAPASILFALYAVTAAILQGINEQRFTVFSLLLGLLIKLSINIPLIKAFAANGAIYATVIGYSVSIIINLVIIRVYANYNYKLVFRRTILIIIFNLIMAATVIFSYKGFTLVLNPKNTMHAVLLLIICALIGASVYAYLGLKTKLADELFGNRVEKLRRKLRIHSY